MVQGGHMKREINTETEEIKAKFNGISKIPFPQASMTQTQREEQAFYESYNEQSFYFFKIIWLGIKVLGKTVKKWKNKALFMLKEDSD